MIFEQILCPTKISRLLLLQKNGKLNSHFLTFRALKNIDLSRLQGNVRRDETSTTSHEDSDGNGQT